MSVDVCFPLVSESLNFYLSCSVKNFNMILFSFIILYLFTFNQCSYCNFHSSQTITDEKLDSSEEDTNFESEPFVATHEWKKVKPGQSVPSGLHIKMDMTTGGKWAKLMDKRNTDTPSALLQVEPNDDESNLPQNRKDAGEGSYDINELKEALKKLKSEKVTDEELQNEENIKSKFRTIDEIRETLDQLDLHEESDIQVMKRLVATIENSTSPVPEKVIALQDLEYYVHQIDNANDLVNFGGFAVVVKALNDSDVTIREEAAHVLGSAVQSNPKVQIEALKSGVLQLTLSMLSKPEEALPVRKKCLFAVSSLIRHFPLAQSKFALYGGFQILVNLFHQEGFEQLQIKAIRLVTDLIEERRNAEISHDDHHNERYKQYERIKISDYIKDQGWCEAVALSLRMQEHGKREAVLVAMKTLYSYCRQEFQKSSVISSLTKLKKEYEVLSVREKSQEETDEEYFLSLHQLTRNLLDTLDVKPRMKDEF